MNPTQQFNKHSLSTSYVPSIQPGAGIKEANKMWFNYCFPARNLASRKKDNVVHVGTDIFIGC